MIAWPEVMLRLILAALLGGVIGFERERRSSTAGLRTHMLVCLGSALAIIVSAFGFDDVLGRPDVSLDPSRVAAQVVSGVGFLGAGAILIMHRSEVVRGLTTAAGLWTVAAIGLAVGSGLYVAALGATVIAWLILFVLKLIEQRIFAGRLSRLVRVQAGQGVLQLADIDAIAGRCGLVIVRASVERAAGMDTAMLWFNHGTGNGSLMPLVDALRQLDGVTGADIESAP